jgi:membrane protein implicated in regulation of membrane protease activity
MAESAGRHPLLRYLLLQAPDVVLAGLVLVGLWNWMDVPTWAAVAAMVVWVGKDVAMYPLVRRSFMLGESDWVGVRSLLGARGVATVDLAPSGWVRVKGELWQAEALREEDSVPEGTRVRVREVRGMILVIERDSEPSSNPLGRS